MTDTYVHMNGFVFWTLQGEHRKRPSPLPQFTIIRSGKAQWNNNKNNTTTRKLMFVHAFISSFANEGEFCSEFHSLRSARSLCPVLKLVLFCCCVQFCSVWWRGMLRIIRFVVLIAFVVRVCSALLSVILLGFQFVCLFFFRFFFLLLFSGEWEWRRNEAAASTSTSSSSFNYPLICSVPSFILWWIVLRCTSSFHFLCLRRRI